jgi:hypothetical protein
LDAVRYYVAIQMAAKGIVSAPNMAVGLPFNMGLTGLPFADVPAANGNGAVAPAAPAQ